MPNHIPQCSYHFTYWFHLRTSVSPWWFFRTRNSCIIQACLVKTADCKRTLFLAGIYLYVTHNQFAWTLIFFGLDSTKNSKIYGGHMSCKVICGGHRPRNFIVSGLTIGLSYSSQSNERGGMRALIRPLPISLRKKWSHMVHSSTPGTILMMELFFV